MYYHEYDMCILFIRKKFFPLGYVVKHSDGLTKNTLPQ